MKDINSIITNSRVSQNSASITDYCETAMNVVEKLADEYFFPVPDNFDEDVFSVQLDKIVNNYEYIAFAVGLVRDALKHIDEKNMNIAGLVGKGVS